MEGALRVIRRVFSISVVLVVVASGAFAAQVADDMGRAVVLSEPARRIVSLSPHTTELLFAAGAGDCIVGVVDFSDYPETAKSLPRVGSAGAMDLERIVALRPDLIVGWRSGNPAAALDRLMKFGIPVFVSEPRRLDDIPSNVERLGALAGTADVAARESRRFRDETERLRAQYSRRAPVRVFYQIWDQPLITVNGEHMISSVLTLCGGTNVFATLGLLAPQIAVESVLAADPEVIILGDSEARHHGTRFWERWPSLRAVTRNHVYHVPPDHMQRQSSRILLGARRVCEILDEVRRQRDGR